MVSWGRMSIKEHPPHNSLHVPVLLDAIVELVRPAKGESYLDLTAGYGGHARRILDMTGTYTESVLVDRDENATRHLESTMNKRIGLMHTDFVSAAKELSKKGKTFDIAIVDLGVSSPQLDKSERGFSLKRSGPLDMRMDQRQATTARTLLDTATADELAHIIAEFGEEPIRRAREIAQAIVKSRPISTTEHLATLIEQTHHGRRTKIHPATRTFQALRIEVNNELKQLEELLPLLPSLLKTGGRVAIISFHSLEDRLVKRYFKEQGQSGFESELKPLNKKPIVGAIQDVQNPRARSAKLRVAVKN